MRFYLGTTVWRMRGSGTIHYYFKYGNACLFLIFCFSHVHFVHTSFSGIDEKSRSRIMRDAASAHRGATWIIMQRDLLPPRRRLQRACVTFPARVTRNPTPSPSPSRMGVGVTHVNYPYIVLISTWHALLSSRAWFTTWAPSSESFGHTTRQTSPLFSRESKESCKKWKGKEKVLI